MEDPVNRMATPRKRGPVAQRDLMTPPPGAIPAEVVDVPQPAVPGIRCPGCGRAMVPRRYGGTGEAPYVTCTLCPARMSLTVKDGRAMTVRLLP